MNRPMRAIRKGKPAKGFTMVEILVVLVILGILSSLATISMSRELEKAQEAQLMAMISNVTTEIYSNIHNYDITHRWGKTNDINYLNSKLETIMENKEYDNVYNYRNPYSGSKVILNSSSLTTKLRNPAVFITNSRSYEYSRLNPKKPVEDLKGTVVIWLNNNVSRVDVFYVDIQGRRSSLRQVIE